MKRTGRLGCVLALAVGASLAAGCGSSVDAGAPDLETRLAKDTGVRWFVDRDARGAALFMTALDPPPPIAASTPRDQAAIAFLQRYADLLGNGDPAHELVLVEDVADRMDPRIHRLRFAQQIPGSNVRVFGADNFVHFDANGSIGFATVGLVPDLAKLSWTPSRTSDEALVAAKATVLAREPQAVIDVVRPPALVVHRGSDGKGVLAWRVQLVATFDGGLEAPEAFVDATTAAILDVHDTVAEADATAQARNVNGYRTGCGHDASPETTAITYDAAFTPGPSLPQIPTNRLTRSGDALHTPIVTDRFVSRDADLVALTVPMVATDPSAFDNLGEWQGSGAAVSTHANLSLADAFFRSMGQAGWDGTGVTPVHAAVHAWKFDPAADPAVLPRRIVDLTAWSGDVLYFGDGIDGIDPLAKDCRRLPAGVALDIVGHEFMHGIMKHGADILTTGESGALNEAIADVLGAGAEHAVRPGPWNFVSGEDSFIGTGGNRDFSAPQRLPPRTPNATIPRAFSERLPFADAVDWGHVHDNSLIGSHAFYLMTNGGVNGKSNIAVPGSEALDWRWSTWLWFTTAKALDQRSSTSFLAFARIQTQLTRLMLWSLVLPQTALSTVACAWRAVEVFTDDDLKLYGVTCSTGQMATLRPDGGTTSPAPDGCAGHGDHLVCDPVATDSALVCKGGVQVAVALCADLTQRCAAASTSDPTATVDADGALVCE